MVDSAYGWNIISDDFVFKIHGQIETVHFCNRATCFRHFRHYMKFPAILVQVHFYPLFGCFTKYARFFFHIWSDLQIFCIKLKKIVVFLP